MQRIDICGYCANARCTWENRAAAMLEWDGKAARVTNNVPAAAQYIRREYRKGCEL